MIWRRQGQGRQLQKELAPTHIGVSPWELRRMLRAYWEKLEIINRGGGGGVLDFTQSIENIIFGGGDDGLLGLGVDSR